MFFVYLAVLIHGPLLFLVEIISLISFESFIGRREPTFRVSKGLSGLLLQISATLESLITQVNRANCSLAFA